MAEIDRDKYMSIGINVVGGSSPGRKPAWRLRNDSKYRGTRQQEIEQRARELARTPGLSRAEMEMGLRELTANDGNVIRSAENFQAGVVAMADEYDRATPELLDHKDEVIAHDNG